MPIVAGSIKEVSLSSRVFQVLAKCDAKVDRGGWINTVEPTLPQLSITQALTPWSIKGLELAIDFNQGDQEFLFRLQQHGDLFPCVISLLVGGVDADSFVLSGPGTIVGNVEVSTATATAIVNLQGPSYPVIGQDGRPRAGLEAH